MSHAIIIFSQVKAWLCKLIRQNMSSCLLIENRSRIRRREGKRREGYRNKFMVITQCSNFSQISLCWITVLQPCQACGKIHLNLIIILFNDIPLSRLFNVSNVFQVSVCIIYKHTYTYGTFALMSFHLNSDIVD